MSTEKEELNELKDMAAIDSDDESELLPPPAAEEEPAASTDDKEGGEEESKPPPPPPAEEPESLLGAPSTDTVEEEAAVEPSGKDEAGGEEGAMMMPVGELAADSSVVSDDEPPVDEPSVSPSVMTATTARIGAMAGAVTGAVAGAVAKPFAKKGPPPERKTGIEKRLDKVLSDAMAGDTPQGDAPWVDEVGPLTKKYQAVRKEMRALLRTIKDYRAATVRMEAERNKLFAKYAALSADTPLFDHVGKLLEPDQLTSLEQHDTVALATTDEGLELQADSVQEVATSLGAVSLATVQQLAKTHEAVNATEYTTYVIEYAVEWEDVVATKLDAEIREVQKLHRNRVHYERKVENLQKKHDGLEKKEKGVPLSVTDKLSRNIEKRANAREAHEQRARGLCALLEAVTADGWRDWFPLVRNSMRYEMNRLGRENVCYGRLPATLDAMIQKSVAEGVPAAAPAPAPEPEPEPEPEPALVEEEMAV